MPSQPNGPPQNDPEGLPGKQDLELAKKMGYVQGVCESVVTVGNEKAMGKRLLGEMNVTKEMAKKYASPKTFEAMKLGVYAQERELKLEHKHIRSL
jgi:hypothetical protein